MSVAPKTDDRRPAPVPRSVHVPYPGDRLWSSLRGRPWATFTHIEAGGGVVLLVATVVALVAANSPWSDAYLELWETDLSLSVGSWSTEHTLKHWINHGLMTLFFFAAGLEIKRELVVGELSTLRAAALPLIAAVGGIVVPAAVYLALSAGEAPRGWGIPVAADIAFAVGLLTLFGRRAPAALKAFVLSLAIADDIGAIAIIAVAYTESIDTVSLLAAAVLVGVVALLRASGVRVTALYVVVGVAAWAFAERSGVHPTLVGVAIALIAPAKPWLDADASALVAAELPRMPSAPDIRRSSRLLRESVSVAERLQDLVHPWTSYVIVPLFALANAGVALDVGALGDALNPVTLGITAGLAAGAPLGVWSFTLLALHTGRFHLPPGMTPELIAPAAFLGGVGFTVALFIADLAFTDPDLQASGRIGVLTGSGLAALAAVALLHKRLPATDDTSEPADRPSPGGTPERRTQDAPARRSRGRSEVVEAALTPIDERLGMIGGPRHLKLGDVCKRTGLQAEAVERLWQTLGRPAPDADEPAFTSADLSLFEHAARLSRARAGDGLEDSAGLERTIRAAAPALRRIAEAHVTASLERAHEPGDDLIDDLDRNAGDFEDLLVGMWRHQLAQSIAAAVSSRPDPRQSELAVGFVDLASYSDRSQQLTTEDLVAMIDGFDAAATEVCARHGATIVKTIGDEVMFVHHDPVAAVATAQELVTRCAADPSIPAARAGVSWGTPLPLAGDYYGPTVNLAARLVRLAGPDAVLVDTAIANHVGQQTGRRFLSLGARTLRGCGEHQVWRVECGKPDR